MAYAAPLGPFVRSESPSCTNLWFPLDQSYRREFCPAHGSGAGDAVGHPQASRRPLGDQWNEGENMLEVARAMRSRVRRTTVQCAVVGAVTLSLLGSSASSAAAATGGADICARMPAGLPVAALEHGVATRLCGGLVGARVVSPTGAGVTVPVEGTIGAEALRTDGAEVITVSNVNGVVSASDERADTTTGLTVPSGTEAVDSVTSVPLACSEGDYVYAAGGIHWLHTLEWYYNSSTQSRSGLSGSGVLDAIRSGNRHITNNYNDCGRTEKFAATGAYSGDTTRYANVNSASLCTTKFPDGHNTVSWGPFDAQHSTTLAYTCWFTSCCTTDALVEADMYLGSNRGVTVGVPSGCSGSYDLESLATHEWGHAFGMAHETSGQWETMYPFMNACSTYQRTLGKGDTDGLLRMYGSAY